MSDDFVCIDGHIVSKREHEINDELATLRSQVERLTGERDAALSLSNINTEAELFKRTQERDQAVASCAVMRQHVEQALFELEMQIVRMPFLNLKEQMKKLSECEKGYRRWISPPRHKPKPQKHYQTRKSLLERLKEARELLGGPDSPDDVRTGWCERRDTWLKGTP